MITFDIFISKLKEKKTTCQQLWECKKKLGKKKINKKLYFFSFFMLMSLKVKGGGSFLHSVLTRKEWQA